MVAMAKQAAEQEDLFGTKSIHELVETHTGRELLKAASNHVKEAGRNNSLDILAGRRGARTIKSAASRAERSAEALLGDNVQA